MKVETSERARHLVLRADVQDVLPDSLTRALRERGVVGGWLRGSGVLAEVELRAYGSDIGGHGAGRRIAGPVQALVLDGTIGIADGDVSLGLRGVFARESDSGMETLAGEIVAARVVALEVVVTALDDVAMPRGIDADAGVWLMTEPARMPARGEPVAARAPERAPAPTTSHAHDDVRARVGGGYAPNQPASPPPPAVKAPAPAWSEAIAASAAAPKDRPQNKPLQPVPIRPLRPQVAGEDGPYPEAGDVVEHFAFGTCEVLKSDGDRLHLKVGKDGRIREIALEMLRVTLLTSDGETQRYKLDRRM